MSKTAFYFRTQKEFHDLFYYVEALDDAAVKHLKLRNSIIRVRSRYLGDPKADQKMSTHFIPLIEATSKKYIGILQGNKHNMERAGIDPIAILNEQSMERIQLSDNLPKYTGETSEGYAYLKGYQQFKKLTSVFNKQFGHGNWKIRGPKRLQKKLIGVDQEKENWESERLRQTYPNGIKVKIIVHKPNVDINKYIFKIALMI